MQRDRVAVPRARFLGVDRADVVVQGAVVAAVVPLAAQLGGQLDDLGGVTTQGSEVEDRGGAAAELAARFSAATRTQPHEPSPISRGCKVSLF